MRRYGERIQKEDFWQKQEAATKERYLGEHGEPQEIILRLDHDEVGRNATKDILSGLKSANAKAVFCEKGKDYNEFLMMQKGLFSLDRSCGKEMDR